MTPRLRLLAIGLTGLPNGTKLLVPSYGGETVKERHTAFLRPHGFFSALPMQFPYSAYMIGVLFPAIV